MTEPELKPCRFCGGKCDPDGERGVLCLSCMAYTIFLMAKTDEDVINSFNERAKDE